MNHHGADMSPTGADPTRSLLFVSHTSLMSGAERVLLRYVDVLSARGHRCSVVLPCGFLFDEFVSRGVAVHEIRELKLPDGPKLVAASRLIGRWLCAAVTVRRVSRQTDLIVVNALMALPTTKLAQRNARTVWLVHDVLTRRDYRALAQRVVPGLRRAIGVSEAAAAFAGSRGVPTTVIRNGAAWPVEPAPFDASPTADGRHPVVGINAMLTEWKGQHVLLEAIAQLPGVDVEIMGGVFPKDQAYRDRLRARSDRPDLAGRVRILGHVGDPLQQMRGWTVAVSASVEPEAGPLAVLEAMSLGVPVVATAHGGAVEILGDAGLLVAPGDAVALRSAIRRLIDDGDLRQRCHDAGRAAIDNGLSIDESNAAFSNAIERTASE